MKAFDQHVFDPMECRKELGIFKALLDGNQQLSETADIRPFFADHRNAAAFIASYVAYIINFDRIAYEFSIGGDFACDLAIGDSKRRQYCLVEFEDARENSIFQQAGKKATRDWAPRFEHGFSQVVDWFWKINDLRHTGHFRDLFGDNAEYQGLLVIGRSTLKPEEKRRLEWRRDRVLVDSQKIHCITFDELYEDLNDRLHLYPVVS